jgi:uncharacterized membrane protein YkvI
VELYIDFVFLLKISHIFNKKDYYSVAEIRLGKTFSHLFDSISKLFIVLVYKDWVYDQRMLKAGIEDD